MLQVELQTFASDALEEAMTLAQTKALNSYSWSDCIKYLNYAWSDIYDRMAMIDDGYFSTTVRLNTKMTELPPFVKNSIRVYGAQDLVGFNREVFRASGMTDIRTRATYHISGTQLFCPDCEYRTVWLSFVPSAPMLFFTRNNRDPKLYDPETDIEVIENDDYGVYKLDRTNDRLILRHKNATLPDAMIDLGLIIDKTAEDYDIHYISCDYPYVFVTYKHKWIENYFLSGFYRDLAKDKEFHVYNPFDHTGRRSNVEYLQCKWNDKTGLGVIIRDYDDYDVRYYNDHKERIGDEAKLYRIKELGFTPDSTIVYPCPDAYRYLVARLADKFAAFNESSVMGVAKELVEAKYAFEAFLAKDKSSWKRIDNVNGPFLTDWL